MSVKTVEVQLLRSPLNWQLSTIYQLYQLFLFTKVYRKNWKNLKKLVDGLETNCYIYYVEIDCSISTRKIENFWKKWKNFNFYPWQNQNNFLYLIRQNKMPLSRRLAENWKNGSFWKLLVINRTYWLQDQSYAPVAQLVAQRTLNPWVEGSSPSWGTKSICGSNVVHIKFRTHRPPIPWRKLKSRLMMSVGRHAPFDNTNEMDWNWNNRWTR